MISKLSSSTAWPSFVLVLIYWTGMILPRGLDQYIMLIDRISAYYSIFKMETRFINRQIAKTPKLRNEGNKWQAWHSYGLIRNYFLMGYLRGIVTQIIATYLNGGLQGISVKDLFFNPTYLYEALLSIAIIASLSKVLQTDWCSKLLGLCSTLTKTIQTLDIIQKLGTPSNSNLNNLLLHCSLNGASTLIAYTLVDLFITGDLRVVDSWIGVRLFYVILPFLHVWFTEAKSWNFIEFQTEFQSKHPSEKYRTLTFSVLFVANFIAGPSVKVFDQ